MCLSIPAKVEAINGDKARVTMSGNEYRADISLIDDLHEGEYVLLHAGFAIQKISEEHARETLQLIEEMNRVKNE